MIRNASIAAATVALMATTSAAAVDVCHIANAGFLIKGEKTSVLIDGLMEEDAYEGRFALPSAETLKAMNERNGLFADLGLVLATHRHGDHFDAKATIRHLRMSEGVKYMVPADALPALDANGLTSEEKSRLFVIPDATNTDRAVNGARVETFDVEHGPNMPQNVGYRVTVDGVSFFHTGDISATREQLEAAGVNALKVDVLIMPFWYSHMDAEQLAAVRASWSADIVLPTHFNPQPQPWMVRFGGPEGIRASISENFNKTLYLTDEGACKTIE